MPNFEGGVVYALPEITHPMDGPISPLQPDMLPMAEIVDGAFGDALYQEIGHVGTQVELPRADKSGSGNGGSQPGGGSSGGGGGRGGNTGGHQGGSSVPGNPPERFGGSGGNKR